MRGHPEDRTKEAISLRLWATRKAMGLNQREVCHRSGIGTSTYNQWEKAVNRPDLDGAIKLCDALELTLDWIYLGDPGRLPHELAVEIEKLIRARRKPR